MPADRLEDPAAALRGAAQGPRRPVDADAVVGRGQVLRRRRVALRTAVAALVAVPVVAGALALRTGPTVDMADDPASGTIRATLSAVEQPPATLADGSASQAPPPAIAARFDRPVVAGRRLDALPPALAAGCDSSGAGVPDRLHALIGPPLLHVGHVGTVSLAVGSAPAPPAYPDTFGVVCLAVPDPTGGTLVHQAGVTHVYPGWTGFVQPPTQPGDRAGASTWWMSAVRVPRGAAWAVQEEPGWWLALDVGGAEWMLAQAEATASGVADSAGEPAEAAFPGGRVVFLDALGRSVGEERLPREAIGEDAPFLRPQVAAARIRFPDVDVLRAELAAGPVPACADEVTVCVWMAEVDGDLLALSAAGPVPDEVPPLGEVGWCPAEQQFRSPRTGAAYAPDGTWRAGPAMTGLHRYEVRVEGDEVVVDLDAFAFGPDRAADGSTTPPTCEDLLTPGFP